MASSEEFELIRAFVALGYWALTYSGDSREVVEAMSHSLRRFLSLRFALNLCQKGHSWLY